MKALMEGRVYRVWTDHRKVEYMKASVRMRFSQSCQYRKDLSEAYAATYKKELGGKVLLRP